MKKIFFYSLSILFLLILNISLYAQDNTYWSKYDWDDVVDGDGLGKNFGSDEAMRIAENVLLYQKECGGWPKNTQMHLILSESQKSALIAAQKDNEGATIDNSAVQLELEYLSNVYKAIPDGDLKTRIKAGFLKGIQYLLDAQYDNGGWPQFYPFRGNYSDHITYNDGAMIHVMEILRHIYQKDSEYSIVAEDSTISQALLAFEKGIECILNTQYVQNGILTAWCAQHHYETLEPVMARSYELASLSGGESGGIVKFLMSIDNPSFEIRKAVYYAAKWYEEVEIVGERIESYVNLDGLNDRRLIYDAAADGMWARFYTLENSTPFFCDRNGIKLYTHEEYNVVLSYERRNGYSWFGGAGEDVRNKYEDWYPLWGHGIEKHVKITTPNSGMGFLTTDTVFVKASAVGYESEAPQSFEVYVDDLLFHTFGGVEIDTFLTNLPVGINHIIVKATDSEANIELDSSKIYIGTTAYNITGSVVGSGEIIIDPAEGKYVDNMEISIFAKSGFPYSFAGWTGDIVSDLNPLTITISADVALTANFVESTSSVLNINFQPEESAIPESYFPDYGYAFADRGNGYMYGWPGGDNFETRHRDGDELRVATLNHMQKSGPVSWEIALSNGDYAVYIHMGDAEHTDQTNSINVEGNYLPDIDGEDNFDGYFIENVTINDGKLTISPSGENAKINFIRIGLAGTVFDNSLVVNNGTGSGEYFFDERVNIEANEAGANLMFDQWIGDSDYITDKFTANTTLNMPDKSISVEATYKTFEYALTVNNGSGSGSFPPGEVISIVAETPPLGQEFDVWIGDVDNVADISIANTTLSMPDKNITVEASYKISYYTLTVINGTGSGSFLLGELVYIVADDPPLGQEFVSWLGDTDNVADTSAASTTITIFSDNIVISASYSDIVSVRNIEGYNTLLCYPNPASNELFIDLSANGRSDLKIIDVTGQVIYNEKAIEGLRSINIQNFATGIYQLIVTDDEGSYYSQKIIKD